MTESAIGDVGVRIGKYWVIEYVLSGKAVTQRAPPFRYGKGLGERHVGVELARTANHASLGITQVEVGDAGVNVLDTAACASEISRAECGGVDPVVRSGASARVVSI